MPRRLAPSRRLPVAVRRGRRAAAVLVAALLVAAPPAGAALGDVVDSGLGLLGLGATIEVGPVQAAASVDTSLSDTGTETDTTPPSLVVDAAPPAATNATDAELAWTAEAGAVTECALTAGGSAQEPFAACASPLSYTGLSDGDYVFALRATDAAGNVTDVVRAFTVDTQAPAVAFDATPALLGNDATPEFSWTAEDGATVQCRLDAGELGACESPLTAITDGEHTLRLVATDAAGNTAAVDHTFTVDTQAPALAFDTTPNAISNHPTPAFTWTAEDGATVQCRLDAGELGACESPLSVDDGEHTLRLVATDAAGNTATVEHTFTVDTAAPAIAFDTTPAALSNDATPTFTWTAADNATVQYRLDDGDLTAGDQPLTLDALPDGEHTLRLVATDAAGNTATVEHTFTVDTAAPAIAFDTTPAALSNDPTPSFTWTSEPGATVQYRLDDGDLTAGDQPLTLDALADGEHTLRLVATDAAGNTAAVEHTFTVDTEAPTLALDTKPAALSNDATPAFTWTAEDGATIRCRLDDGELAPCESPLTVTDGEHVLRLVATDGAGNTATAEHTFTVDTQAPAVAFDTTPAALSNDATPTFTWTADPGATVQYRLDDGQMAAADTPLTLHTVADGEHTVRLAATDAAGNIATAEHTFTVDTHAPALDLTESAASIGDDPTPTFAWTAEAAATVECRMDDADFAVCESPQTLADVADGTHTFRLRATDAAGNTATVERTFTVDTAGPALAFDTAPPALSNDTTATFAWTAEAGASVQCRLDGADFAACESPRTLADLADGTHTFQLRATDAAGNTRTIEYTFTVDTEAPAVALDTKPAALSNDATPTFTWTAEPGATVRYRLDDGDLTPGDAPLTLDAIADGEHTLRLVATDPAGNTASVEHTFTVDTQAPAVAFDTTPAARSNDATPTFTWTAEPDATVHYRLDAGDLTADDQPLTLDAIADGEHTLRLVATDAAGNTVTVDHTFTVDTQAPAVAFDTKPAALSNDATPTFTWTAEAGATVHYRLDDGDLTAGDQPLTLDAIADGEHTLRLVATDPAGNTATAEHTFTVDTQAPTLAFDTTPAALSNDATPTFTWTAEPGATVHYRLDDGQMAAADTPLTLDAIADGEHTLRLVATDGAGNTAAVEQTFTVDTQAPALVFDTTPAAVSNDATPTFTWTAEPGAAVECRLDDGDFAACETPLTLDPLADGSHTILLRATDEAGNKRTAGNTFEIDTLAPGLTLDAVPAALSNDTTPTVNWTAEPGATAACRIDGGTFTPCTPAQTFGPVADGSHAIQVRATDAAGNTRTVEHTFAVDTQAPALTLTETPAAVSNDATPTIAWTAEAGATVQCRLDGGDLAPCSPPQTYGPLADGNHTIQVRATDAAGNVRILQHSFTIDTQAPALTFTEAPAAVSNDTTPTVAWTADAGAIVQCRLDGGDLALCTSPRTFGPLADGNHTIQVRATDAVGNTRTVDQAFTVDTQPPAITLTEAPAAASNDTTPTIAWAADAGATFQCRLDGGEAATCTSPQTYGPLAAGDHTIQVRATDAAGNTGTVDHAFSIHTQAPALTLTETPAALSNDATPTIAWTTDAGATVECRLDEGAFAACTSPQTSGPLADGSHTIQVRASDAAGNARTVDHTFAIDTQAPALTLTETPAAASSDTTPTVAWTAEAGATVECRLDDGTFAACASPQTSGPLADGSHTIQVRATDAAGNARTVDHAFAIDTQGPALAIVGGPTALTTAVSPSFSWTAEAGSTVACGLAPAGQAPQTAACSSPRTFGPLADGAFVFTVTATDAAGNATTRTHAFTVDTQAPTVPAGLTGTARGPAIVDLSWQPAQDGTGVTAYRIYRDTFTSPIATVTGTSFSDSGLATASTHRYRVSAVDALGHESAQSAQVTVTTTGSDTAAPTVPKGAAATAMSPTRIDIAWLPSSDAVGVAGYRIYRDGSAAPLATVTGTSYSDTSVAAGTEHGYRIAAFDAVGNLSAKSTSVWAVTPSAPDTQAPSVPAGLDAIAITGTRVELTWDESTDNVEVAGYLLYRNSLATPLARINVGSGYSDTRAVAGTTYTYWVRAFDASGNQSAVSAPIGVTTPGANDTAAPTTPTGVTATAVSANGIDVAWQPSSDNVGVAFYRVYRNGGSTPIGTVAGLTYSDTVAASTTASYEVVAVDASGNASARSVAVSATTPAAPDTQAPTAPGALQATAASDTTIALTWSAATDDRGVTGYRVYRDGATDPLATVAVTSFTDTGLEPATRHTYVVTAVDAAGNESPTSGSASATTTDTEAPSVPAGLAATAAGQTAVDLSWDASSDAVGVTGYRVYRNGVAVATVATTSYRDTGLAAGSTQAYRVSALDAAGNESARSAQVSATTDAPDTAAPAVPTGLAGVADGPTSVRLTWSASTDNVGVSGYRVYRGTQTTPIATVTTTTYTDGTVTAGSTTRYRVTAIDAASNESAKSAEVAVTTPTVDNVAPVVTAAPAATLAERDAIGAVTAAANVPVRVAWAATDSSGVAKYELQRSVNGGAWTNVALPTPTTQSVKLLLAPGSSYRYRVRATDTASKPNVSAYEAGPAFNLTAEQEGKATYTGTWTAAALSGAYGGNVRNSTATNARATYTFSGTRIAWVSNRGARGKATISLDGGPAETLDLYNATTVARQLVWTANDLAPGTHTVTITVTGTKNAASSAKRVDVDGFIVLAP